MTKKYVCFAGSPRKKGNSDLLADQVIKGAEHGGMKGKKVYIYDTEIKPCQGCLSCDQIEKCILDDWNSISETVNEADALIFSTAIYSRLMTGPMKCFIDRLRPFMKIELTPNGPVFSNRFTKPKKMVFITANSAPLEEEANPAIDIFVSLCEKLTDGKGLTGVINGYGLKHKGQVAMDISQLKELVRKMHLPLHLAEMMKERNEQLLKDAYKLGLKLSRDCSSLSI